MKTLAHLLAATSIFVLACADESFDGDDADCEGSKCDDADEVGESPCDGILVDKAGRGLGTGTIAGTLGDSLAVLAFGDGESCPATFQDIVTKLVESKKCDGHRSMLVSETSQLLAKPDQYRSVTFMECEVEKDKKGSVWFSGFGIQAESDLAKTTIPSNAEMFAFDPVAGVFNYYETKTELDDEGKPVLDDEGKVANPEIHFFGNSEEFITAGPSGEIRRCGGCHTGGGPIMKELNAPWLHWEGDFDTPGVDEILTANAAIMGTTSDGIDLEGIVSQGNDEWNDVRLKFLKDQLDGETSLALLLKPLFCTVEVNIDSETGKTVSGVSLGETVVDTTISGFGSVAMSNTEYTAILKQFGSRMAVGSKKTDTIGAFTRITRGETDTNYQQKLIDGRIINQEFVEDVLLVDFTRSIFSTERCELLEFAPKLAKKDATSTKVRDGFIKNLEDAGDLEPAAADFLRNLKEAKDDPRATVAKFEETCGKREGKVKAGGKDVSAAALDVMTYVLNVREAAVKLQVFEFDGFTTPVTNVGRPTSTRLHPETCELTTKYVSVTPVLEGQPEEPMPEEPAGNDSCQDRCNMFTEGATCQCDANCSMFNNCCADKAMVCGE